MKGMKKCLVAGLVSSMVLLVTGCGDDAPTLTAEQQFQLKMAQIEANKQVAVAEAVNQPQVVNNVEYEYEVEQPYEQENLQPALYSETHSATYDSVDNGAVLSVPANADSGSNVGSVLLGAATGAIAGYTAGAILNSGHREYTAPDGSKYYTDAKGKPVTPAEYESYRKQNPKLTKARDIAAKGQSKVGTAVEKTKGKVTDTYKRVANSNTVQTAKGKIQQGREKFNQSTVGQTIKQKAKTAKEKTKSATQVIKQQVQKKYNSGKKRGKAKR